MTKEEEKALRRERDEYEKFLKTEANRRKEFAKIRALHEAEYSVPRMYTVQVGAIEVFQQATSAEEALQLVEQRHQNERCKVVNVEDAPNFQYDAGSSKGNVAYNRFTADERYTFAKSSRRVPYN